MAHATAMAQAPDDKPMQVAVVENRGRRHLARIMESFEANVQAHVPREHKRAVDDFKAKVRDEIRELVEDSVDFLSVSGESRNLAAIELRSTAGVTSPREPIGASR